MAAEFYPALSPFAAGVACRCPRCGRGRLYKGYLTVAANRVVCGLDLSRQDSGDGPAVFIIMILGFVVVGLALWVEMTFQPPYWLHAALWLPLIIGGALGLLRPFKGVMVALHYKHQLLAPASDPEPE